jgi:regulator of Ty1 transposition protein 109
MGGGGGRLSELLAAAIPSSHPHKYRVHYLLSPPSKHESLFPPQQPPKSPQKHKSSKSPSHTTCQHHLLLLSYESTFIYAIEVLIYRSKAPPIIYVSKADTTGYGPASITRQVTTAFLSYLLQYCGGGTIQLFARSQPQYIFPCSATNGKKHILDDTQLIKWWLRVLSPLDGLGKVYIPGVDKYQIKSYYPEGGKWEHAPPGSGGGVGVLAKDVVPVFPDDPKARFLDDLKTDGQLSTTTLDQFWELMEHRQECSSGRLVGFISTFVQGSNTATKTDHGVVVDEKILTRAYEMLINGEYSSVEIASGATGKWIESILAIIPNDAKEKWGFDLIPSGVEEVKNADGGKGDTKKRPAETKPVNMLGGGLVRKKPKT